MHKMSSNTAKTISLSLGRRVVCDFLALSKAIPLVTVQKEMDVSATVAARQVLTQRPSWSSIMTKAFAKVVATRPDLRRAYLSFPYERLYEYAKTTVDVVCESVIDGEPVLVTVPLKRPDTRPLLDFDRRLDVSRTDPVKKIRRYRRARLFARLPRFVRNPLWWLTLNSFGFVRRQNFATFGVTSVGNWGVESLRPLAPWTTLLHYGTIQSNGKVNVRLTYDHRVLDGSGPSLALVEMERMLQTELVAELKSMLAETELRKAG